MATSKINLKQLFVTTDAVEGQVPTVGASGPLVYRDIVKITKYVTGINLKTVAQTTLYTVPLGKRFIPVRFAVVTDNITEAAAMPTVRFGTSVSTELYLAAEALNAVMNARNKVFSWEIIGDAVDDFDAVTIQFGVTVGGTSTGHTGTALVEGWLTDSIPTPP
jgi:hypothetical protein